MPTSRFHLTLTTARALGLGGALTHALVPATAIGYPAGPTISHGANPVVSAAGSLALGGGEVALTAPSDQDLVITDTVLSVSASDAGCMGAVDYTLSTSDGTAIAHFTSDVTGWREVPLYYYAAYGHSYGTDPTQAIHFNSGLRIQAGDTVEVAVTGRAIRCDDASISARYTLSGYYAQP